MGIATSGYVIVTGTNKAINGQEDQTVIAAQGAGTVLKILKANVVVVVAGTGGTAHWALEDGLNGTQFMEGRADAVGVFSMNFGDEGYPLTANTLLNLTTENAGGTQASVRATVVAKI